MSSTHDELEDTHDAATPPVRGFDNEAPAPFQEASIADLLKQDVAELAASKEVYIPVKGYERTGLQVRYHLPASGKELDAIANKARREEKDNYARNLIIAQDVMIHLCDGLFVQPGEVSEPVMLDPDDTGVPCSFDQRLAELLGMEGQVTSARQVVRKLFGNNDLAIVAHSEKLNRWLQNTKADLSLEAWQTGE